MCKINAQQVHGSEFGNPGWEKIIASEERGMVTPLVVGGLTEKLKTQETSD
jgi:hypothetical protein